MINMKMGALGQVRSGQVRSGQIRPDHGTVRASEDQAAAIGHVSVLTIVFPDSCSHSSAPGAAPVEKDLSRWRGAVLTSADMAATSAWRGRNASLIGGRSGS